MSDYDRIQRDNNYIAMRDLTKALNKKEYFIMKNSTAAIITFIGCCLMVGIYLI